MADAERLEDVAHHATTARAEVTPAGLSSTSQPSSARAPAGGRRLRPIAVVAVALRSLDVAGDVGAARRMRSMRLE